LGKVLVDVGVSIFESLLSELGDLSLHHAGLVSEEAVRSTKEALEGYYLLEEAKFGVRFLLSLGFNGLLNSRVDLLVDLGSGQGLNASLSSGLLECRLH
jgi:hypothetical protein